MEKPMIIAYVCDYNYEPYLRKSIESVRRYNPGAEIAVITNNLLHIDGLKTYRIEPDAWKFKFKTNDRMHDGVYYKFYLPQLPYDKVLFLDTDIICQRPLNALWAEKCPFICATESHAYGAVQARQLGVEKYALTGMMLCNLKAMRKTNFTQKCLDRLAKENPAFHDETIINLVFNDKIRFIDKKYNYCRNRPYLEPIPEQDAYLLHYVGGKQKADMLTRDNFSRLYGLKELLSGKRVAIVGNSQSILSKEQGAEIDGHDIVIRFNKGFPSDKVGHKTSIVFLACTLTDEERLRYKGAYLVRRSKLCQNNCDFAVSKNDRVQLAQTPTPAVRARGKGLCQPSTGFIAINFALSCACKSIDLYGFDFFTEPTYYNVPGYVTLHNGPKEAEKVLEYEQAGLLKIL